MSAHSLLQRFTGLGAIAAAVFVGAAVVATPAEARDRFSFGVGFDSWGSSSVGFGYSSGGPRDRYGWDRGWGHRGWGHRGWGHRGWSGDHLSLGFTFVVPPASYAPRYYDYPFAYGAAPYGYPARRVYATPFHPAGGVVVFPGYVRDRLGARTRGVYYDAYRSALDAPVGEPIDWQDGRMSGAVTTTRDGWAGERYCREFRQNIVIDGRSEEAYGTACRNAADTDWEIIPN